MFLKSRSQYNTSGKLLRSELGSMVRMASLFWRKNAKFLMWFGNGLLLPSSLHSKLCLRSMGRGAPRTRTTGASFRSKDWAFGPFPCFSSCFPFCLFSCCFVKQDMARSLRSLALAVSSNMPVPIDWRRYNIVYNRCSCCAQHAIPAYVQVRAVQTCASVSYVVACRDTPSNIRVVYTGNGGHVRVNPLLSQLVGHYGTFLHKLLVMHRFDSCGVHYPPVKDDFTIPIFIIVFNIWPFGAIFGCYGTLSDDSDSAQVRLLRHPQREGQRGRCSAKHTKS